MNAMTAHVRIAPWADGDLDLLRRKNEPEMTKYLGGPESEEKLLARHERYLNLSGPGVAQMFSVVLLPEGEKVGSVGYWEKVWQDEWVYETGWGVLPEYQGRGIAAAAAISLIETLRPVRKHQWLHAFPSVEHLASNAICRKAGFSFVAECEFEYPKGTVKPSNDWRFDLG
jgi:RimJ/RimL family protein N-acetyltransferase